MTIKPFLTADRFTRAVAACAEVFGIPPTMLVSPSRLSALMPARFALYAACYETTGAGYQGVGFFVQRNHTTVMYGVEKAHEYAKDDPEYWAAYTHICEALR